VQGFKSAFLPFREKQDLLRAVNAEIAQVLGRHLPGAGARGGRAEAPGAAARAVELKSQA
jgi:adenosine deaminase